MKTTLKAIVLTATLAGTMISFTGCTTTQVDPFENINVKFGGISEYATTAEVDESKLSDELSDAISYNFSYNTEELKNGDVIKVSASADEEELKELGIELTATTKEITISGLSEYRESIADCDYSEASAQIKNRIESFYTDKDKAALSTLCREFRYTGYNDEEEDLLNSEYEFSYEITGEEVMYYGGTEGSRQKNRFAPVFRVDVVLKMGNAVGCFEEASNKTYNITTYITQAVRSAVDKDNKVFVCEKDDELFNGQYYTAETLEEIEEQLFTMREMFRDGAEKLEFK